MGTMEIAPSNRVLASRICHSAPTAKSIADAVRPDGPCGGSYGCAVSRALTGHPLDGGRDLTGWSGEEIRVHAVVDLGADQQLADVAVPRAPAHPIG